MKNKIGKFINKLLDEALKIVMSIALGVAVTNALIIFGVNLGPFMTALIYLLTVPGTYIGVTVYHNKFEDARKREGHQFYQLTKSMNEAFSFDNDKTVSKDTTMFFSKIDEKKGQIELDKASLDAINQFLYMINENYYDIITEINPSISRETLVDILITAIIKYLKKYDQDFFDDIDVEEILKSLFIIDEKLRKRIVKEFRAARTKVDGHYEYRIISKNVTEEMIDDCINGEEVVTKTSIHNQEIDLTNPHTYEYLINVLAHDENNNYGDFSEIPWDMDFLRQVVHEMTTTFKLLIQRERGEFDAYALAVSFVYNVGVYAMVNNRGSVSAYEIIQTFKEWEYLERETKVMIVDYLFEKYNLDSSMYPYQKLKNYRPKPIIIPLPNKKDDNN